MSDLWTLRNAAGLEQSAAVWGISELVRQRVNQRTDVVTFRAPGRASDADPLFAYGSTVQILRGEVPWFFGRVISVPSRANGPSEDHLYRLAGPWWYLENIIFQQAWQTTSGTSVTLIPTNKSRLILTQKADGSKLDTGSAIQEILAYAIARGAPMTVGSITPNVMAPYTEELDESCAEVMRHLLRWTPDAIARFDYSTTPYPTLSILRRASAASTSLPAYGPPTTTLHLTPRYDLQVPSVVLKFEQTNDISGNTYNQLTVQPAPVTATGDELGAVVMTLQLAGERATYQRQMVRTAVIPTSDTDPNVIDWWKGKFAWLQDFADTDLMVVGGTQAIALENPANYPDVTPNQIPNELLEGAIKPWMRLAAAPLRVSATLKFIGTPTAESSDVFGPSGTRVLFTRVIGTAAQTNLYQRLTSETAAEAVPIGLAQALYDATRILAYDGVIGLTEPECSGLAAPGDLLNLSGGRAEWATMATAVQQVEEQIDTGTTRLLVGPAHHLGPADLATLLRVNRQRRPSYRVEERTSGQSTGNASITDGGQQLPRSDSVHRPSSGGASTAQPFQLLDASDSGGLKIKVNPDSFLQTSLLQSSIAVGNLGSVIPVSVGSRIWLEIDFDANGNTTAASINSGTSGWPGYPTPLAYSGSAPNLLPTNAYLVLGYLVATTSSHNGTTISGGPAAAPVKAKIVQCVTQSLLLRAGSYNGQPAIYPYPHHAPCLP